MSLPNRTAAYRPRCAAVPAPFPSDASSTSHGSGAGRRNHHPAGRKPDRRDVSSQLSGSRIRARSKAARRHHDVLKGTAILQYALEDEPGRKFGQLQNAFTQLSGCQAVWHVNAAGHTDDWKRNSGVGTLTRRSTMRPSFGVPPRVNCNIKVPVLKATRTALYFFPDRLLVYDSGGVGAVPYSDLHAQAGQVRFVEADQVPRDAAQVGTTWQFVNKKGGPDRRFNNNRQLPVMLYGELLLTSVSGLKVLFQMSVPATAVGVAAALSSLGTRHASVGTSG